MKTLISTHIAVLLGVLAAIVLPDITLAQFYGGPGIVGGINDAQAIGGVSGGNITTVVLEVLRAVLLFMGLAAVVVIVIAGIYLVVSVGDESAKDKAKKIITYAVAGLVVIAISAAIVTVIINAVGGSAIFGDIPDLGVGNSSQKIRDVILNTLLAVLSFMGLAAVVVIVIAGIYLVVSVGDESAKDKAKKIITYALAGLVLIVLATAVTLLIINAMGAQNIFGPVPVVGSGADIRQTVLRVLNAVLNFMGLIAVVMIVIAGIYLVVSQGEEQIKDKAKRIIWYTIIGLFVILFAKAIVVFVISSIDKAIVTTDS